MVQATLASMRHYCPNVPLCLSVDGDFDVSDLKKQYNLIVLRVSELPSEPMRKLICGIIAQSLLRCGRVRLNSMCGSIQTRLFGATSFPTSGLPSISKFFGARFPSQRLRSKSHHGYRIFISIQ